MNINEHIPSRRLEEIALSEVKQSDFEKVHINDCVECLSTLIRKMNGIIHHYGEKRVSKRVSTASGNMH